MKQFMDENFMLTTPEAVELYHTYAASMPIIDYHCHLDPKAIANDYQFSSITEAWLGGDHYKWRAMRGNGVGEQYITGKCSDYERFEKWAATVPYLMRNPLYHWTHLELSRLFGIDKVLSERTAREIYDECNRKLAQKDFTARGLLLKSKVEVVCTTDDPADSLEYHKQIKASGFAVKVLPTWRPDKALAIQNPTQYNGYISTLEAAAEMSITSYEELLEALRRRHDFFATMGCRLSDHGMETFPAEDYTETELMQIFSKVRSGKVPTAIEVCKFMSGLLFDLAVMDADKGWVQQFHIGVIRNNNSRMFDQLGPDTGFDAITDVQCAEAGHRFLNRLEVKNKLTKTILYNLNPKDNEVLATMAYTFNDGSVAGKMQFGAAWWFLDNEEGMRSQINALSALGLLSRFVGMLTDSRSLLSYPRHEYFRRILCDMIGEDINKGKLPRSEMSFIGEMVEGIAYRNAKEYFNF